MAFPQTPLPIEVALQVAGVWQDITPDVRYGDGSSVKITRGRSDEGQAVDRGTCTLTLDNRTGKYTARNPLSPLYGLVGRNTPLQVSVLAGPSYLNIPGGGGSTARATTPDAAALDITGDIDVRADLTPQVWLGDFPSGEFEVMAKYNPDATNQRSWRMLVLNSGQIEFTWSPDGVNILTWLSGNLVPFSPGRRGTIRATLDVDNGLGGYTISWYTGPTIDGPWTQLNQVITSGGTTNIFASAAPLEVGGISNLAFDEGTERINKIEVRNGIEGTLVAAPDFTAQAVGATSFTDSTGRVWSMVNGATISNRRVRFTGEVSYWPVARDDTGRDVTVPIVANGILQRLGSGSSALQSTLRRSIPSEPSLQAYWPMEDGDTATQAASGMMNGAPLKTVGFKFASVDTLAGSGPLPTLDSNSGALLPQMSGTVPRGAAAASEWKVEFLYRIDQPDATVWTIIRLITTGTGYNWYVQMSATTARLIVQDSDGDEVFRQDLPLAGFFLPFGDWYRLQIIAKQTGSTVTWRINWINVGGVTNFYSNDFSGTLGRVTTVAAPPDGYASALDGMALGHLTVMTNAESTIYNQADTGFTGETALARVARLAAEEGLPVLVRRGFDDTSETMGPQTPKTVLALLQECADADDGILYESRGGLGLVYLSRCSLYNQTPTVIPYLSVAAPITPVDDDQLIANDVTVTRSGGSSGRVTQTEGPLSVSPPPAGVGTYATSVTLNLAEDDRATQHAGQMVRAGTIDEPRYPVVNVALHHNPELIEPVTDLDTGWRMQIPGLPPTLPPGPIDQIVEGYSETISQFMWSLAYNCTPAESRTVGQLPPAPVFSEGFENANPTMLLTTGGNKPWARTNLQAHTGSWSLKSGAITNNQTSDAILTLPADANDLRFWYRVNSETAGSGFAGDRFVVLVDGVQKLTAQGVIGWTQATLNVVDAGVVTFRYVKDNSTAAGEDAAYIDDLHLSLIVPDNDPPRADTGGSQLAASVAENEGLLVTTTGEQPWIDSATFPDEFPFDIAFGGEVATVTGITSEVDDQFGRTVASGWGVATTGQTWATSGGATSDYSVKGV